MKIIKFRGRFWNKDKLDDMPELEDGDYIYGGYSRMQLFSSVGEGDYIINDGGCALLVYSDSVAQFIAYDRNGKEIYSDDAIRVYNFNRYGISIDSWVENAEDFFKISDIGNTFDNVELVEEK